MLTIMAGFIVTESLKTFYGNGDQGVEVYLADWGSASRCASAEETFLDYY